jgi:hypothetical protein
MTKTQVEGRGDHVGRAAAPLVTCEEGADRGGGHGAWCGGIGGGTRGRDPRKPTVSVAAGAVRSGPRCAGLCGRDNYAGAVALSLSDRSNRAPSCSVVTGYSNHHLASP